MPWAPSMREYMLRALHRATRVSHGSRIPGMLPMVSKVASLALLFLPSPR